MDLKISMLNKAVEGDPVALAEFDAWMASIAPPLSEPRKPRFDTVSPPLSEMPQRASNAARRHRVGVGWFRRLIVRAAPTCTLWRACYCADYYEFVFWPHWKISAIEMIEAGA